MSSAFSQQDHSKTLSTLGSLPTMVEMGLLWPNGLGLCQKWAYLELTWGNCPHS
eukprot:Gb_32626 [translate_table: standard]